MPERYTKEQQRILLTQFLVLCGAGFRNPNQLFKWAQSVEGQQLLSCKPSRVGLYKLIRKFKDNNLDIEKSVQDSPRCQSKRTGKRAPLTPRQKRAIITKLQNPNRTKKQYCNFQKKFTLEEKYRDQQ